MGTRTFTFTGGGQFFTVPAGVTTIQADVRGGKCGAAEGGRTRGKFAVYPGQVLYLVVGGPGRANNESNGGAGGWPNGGQGGDGHNGELGGTGGGGVSYIRKDAILGTIVCAAGGAGGRAFDVQGGAGGGAQGKPGKLNNAGDTGANSAQPGTQTTGGDGGHSGVDSALDGGDGTGGTFGPAGAGGEGAREGGGGGGGGYRSGGGGRARAAGTHPAAGGGGGSGYSGLLTSVVLGQSDPTTAPASNIILSWAEPGGSLPPNPPTDIEINGIPEVDELVTEAVGVFTISAVLSRTITDHTVDSPTGKMLVRVSPDASFSTYTDYYTPDQPLDETPRRRTINTNPLAANTHYHVRVWAISSDGLVSTTYNSANFWTNRSPNPPELQAPVENANLPGGVDITFDWNSVDADPDQPGDNPQKGWELQYREQRRITDAGGPLITITNTEANAENDTYTVDDSQFKGATFYEWRVRIHDRQGFWSDWSLFNSFYIISGVRPPVLISPVNDEAVAVDETVRLRWQFRDPNGDGLDRTDIRYRAIGTEEWINDFAGGTDTLLYRDYPAGTFTPGVHYEWQARTWDDTITESEWSDSETFWAINTPGLEAAVTPLYVGDQRELGAGTYRVFLYQQGGQQILGEITHHTLLRFRRIRDDISNATVVYNGSDAHICELLANVRCWMHEIVVFRNGKRVWEGPVTLITYESNQVTIEAQDVMAYLYRRIMRQGYNDSYRVLTFQDDAAGGVVSLQIGLSTVVERASRIIVNGLAPHDMNLLPYLTRYDFPDDARQSRVVPDYATTCWQEVDDLAANAGLDYTVVGRRIILWDTHRPIGRLPQMGNDDFSEPPIVSEYGMQLANYYAVTNGNGVWGKARPQDEEHENDFYGPIELLTSSYGESDAGNEEVLTQEARAKLIETLEEQAARGVASRWPTPLIVRVPDNSTLNPNVEVGFDQLVPGVWIPLIASGTCRTVEQWQKLDEVTVEVTPRGETISVTMSPAPNNGLDPDAAAGGDSGGVHEGTEGEVIVQAVRMIGSGQMVGPVPTGNGGVVYATPMVGSGRMSLVPVPQVLVDFTCEDLSDAVFQELDGNPVGFYNSGTGKIEGLPPTNSSRFSFPALDAALDPDATFDFRITVPITSPFTVSYKASTTTVLRTFTAGSPNPLTFSLTPSDLGPVAADPGGSLIFQATAYNKVSEFCWNKIGGPEPECFVPTGTFQEIPIEDFTAELETPAMTPTFEFDSGSQTWKWNEDTINPTGGLRYDCVQLQPDSWYEVRLTRTRDGVFPPPGAGDVEFIFDANGAYTWAGDFGGFSPADGVITWTIGPGIGDWDAAVAALDFETNQLFALSFDSDAEIEKVEIREISDPWNYLDLSTAEFYDGTTQFGDPNPTASWSGTRIEPPTGHSGVFFIPGFQLPDYTKDYIFEFTIELVSGTQTFVSIDRTLSNTQTDFDGSNSATISFLSDNPALVRSDTVGPGIDDWDTAQFFGWDDINFWFRANNAITQVRWRML